MRRPLIYCLFLIVVGIVAVPTYAYLDPASGSMLLQLILGGVAGLAILIKLYWHKLLGLLRLKKRNDDNSAP
jgi:hypothetical protein